MHTVIVSAPYPYNTVAVQVNDSATCSIYAALSHKLPEAILNNCYLHNSQLLPRLCGGKGGFGAQLRSAGGRMRKGLKPDKESMKDVNGRRIRTLKKAQAMAEALRDAPERDRAAREEERARLMGILNQELPGRQIKFDDEEYINQSEAILEDIKAAMEQAYAEDDSEEGGSLKSALDRGYDQKASASMGGWNDDADLVGFVDSSDEEVEPSSGKGKEKRRKLNSDQK